MCGPFVPLLCDPHSKQNPTRPHTTRILLYHLGRALAYLGLGAMAGYFGSSLQAYATGVALQHAVAIMMATGLLWAAYRMACPTPRLVKLRVNPERSAIARLRTKVLSLRQRAQPQRFSLALGLASGLLPCGWLWSYVWLAATRSTPLAAILTMFAFWLGTLPALTLLAIAMPGFKAKLRRHAPRLGALALTVLAALTLIERWPQPGAAERCASAHAPARQ